MSWIKTLQTNIGATPDGIAGPKTFTLLFTLLGAKPDRAAKLASAAKYFNSYGVMDNPLRLAHFLAQVAHESGNFRYMEEIWGPTDAQKRYEGRKDLGNVETGDGFRYKGRGPIQITGRANYAKYGKLLGIDLEGNPAQAADPEIGIRIALEYWKQNNLNVPADADDVTRVTKRINGGVNGLDDRKAKLAKMKKLMGL